MKFDICGIFLLLKFVDTGHFWLKIEQKYRAFRVRTHVSFCEPLESNSLNIYRDKKYLCTEEEDLAFYIRTYMDKRKLLFITTQSVDTSQYLSG
jgi:hypothetical protein